MTTNADIEQVFLRTNVELNQKINTVLLEFFKPDLDRNKKLMEAQRKQKPSGDVFTAIEEENNGVSR